MVVSDGKGLPSFGNPPVVETVLGVQFIPLVKLKSFHGGQFWSELGEGWSRVEESPLIPAAFERFDDSPPLDLLFAFEVGAGSPVRLRMRSDDGAEMVQLQRDRLHYNWLGGETRTYPRYPEVRVRFDSALNKFRGFLENQKLGELQPNQWEVTYVNRLSKDGVWNSAAEHLAALKLTGNPEVEGLVTEAADLKLRFLIPPNRGRLHVESLQQPDHVRLTLTARGPAQTLEELSTGLDLGRKTIVTAFARLTSAEAQKAWSPGL